ncbi:hypothetical protein WJ79_00170 [Burkholderia ubonensis]|uniref:phospholipase D-like domain-containing protein n=1 Tax=Burkholderia ubonensis TaxID=101571 RepID=UPI000756B825|nr:phospholipase D-like domain-containing protein [Burkholderia ubonensis]KVO78899.1 hypothetical protein WJ79_00170 [Burkholderia ubonensis]
MDDQTLDTDNPASFAIDEQARTGQAAVQLLLEKRDDIAPITYGNELEFIICGENGFRSIAENLRAAKSTVDLVCWGFDPGMELERNGEKWPRGTTYGELLEEITTRKENPVTVRLMVWYDKVASAKQNNVPGYSDNGGYYTNPLAWVVSGSSPYASPERHQFCVNWWKRNRPKGNVSGQNPRLQVVFRDIEKADVQYALSDEKDKPVSGPNPLNESNLMGGYPTHHQKPILIDYAHEGGKYAVGYVMGLNSVTDYWDRTDHKIDDPLREALIDKKLEDEQAHEQATQGEPATKGYKHGRPYRDYACRVVGPALKRLHENFVRDWNIFAPDHQVPELAELPPNIPTQERDPALAVQILRTHPREKEKTIKELYYHASRYARNYIYIENQYFFYPDFARELKKTRENHWDKWVQKSGLPPSLMPMLHLFIVIPHPEDDGMIPRTYDTISELGGGSDGNAMPEQRQHLDRIHASQDYEDSRVVTYTIRESGGMTATEQRKVLDTPSVQELIDTYGLKVSIARLRASGTVGDRMAYREIYIHSKLMIIDDVFVTVGSANLNQRSMATDSEINIAATGTKYAAKLREDIFKLLTEGQISGSGDSSKVPNTFDEWQALMDTNRGLWKVGKQPLSGFLLPFEDHRSTTTMHASVDIPSTGNTALV